MIKVYFALSGFQCVSNVSIRESSYNKIISENQFAYWKIF